MDAATTCGDRLSNRAKITSHFPAGPFDRQLRCSLVPDPLPGYAPRSRLAGSQNFCAVKHEFIFARFLTGNCVGQWDLHSQSGYGLLCALSMLAVYSWLVLERKNGVHRIVSTSHRTTGIAEFTTKPPGFRHRPAAKSLLCYLQLVFRGVLDVFHHRSHRYRIGQIHGSQ